MLLSLFSLLLSGCDNTNTKVIEEVEETVESETTEEVKHLTAEEILGFTDYSKYDFYDDTALIGLNIRNVEDETISKYIMIEAFKVTFDSEEYGTIESFLEDAKKESMGYLTAEEFEESNIRVTLTRYKGIDGMTSYHEKRIVFEVPKSEETELLVLIDRSFVNAENEYGVAVRSVSSSNGINNCVGCIYNGDEFYDLFGEDAISTIATFNIPSGVYTKDDLFKLLEIKEDKGLQK